MAELFERRTNSSCTGCRENPMSVPSKRPVATGNVSHAMTSAAPPAHHSRARLSRAATMRPRLSGPDGRDGGGLSPPKAILRADQGRELGEGQPVNHGGPA